MCAFSPRRAGTLCPEKCLSGRENHDEKDILSPLRPAAGAGLTPADRRLPADTGGVRPGTGDFFCSSAGHCGFGSRPGQRRRAALRSGQRELSAGRPERRGRGLGAPAGLSDRCRGGGNAHQLAGRGAQGAGHRGPQLCSLLPRPYCRTGFWLAERGPRPAAGILNRCSPPQLLGHRL